MSEGESANTGSPGSGSTLQCSEMKRKYRRCAGLHALKDTAWNTFHRSDRCIVSFLYVARLHKMR